MKSRMQIAKWYKQVAVFGCLMLMFSLTACSLSGSKNRLCMDVPEAPEAELDLAEPGKFYVSKTSYKFTDPARKDRPVGITVWYPALRYRGYPEDKLTVGRKLDPDKKSAPYPLILSSFKVAEIFAPYVVSHGFVWAGVENIDTYMRMNPEMYNQPLDILFALDKIATEPPEILAGMVNSDLAGTIGYSFDGYNSLALSGARIDPAHYLSQCADEENIPDWGLSSFSCLPARDWDKFVSGAGDDIKQSDDGLWQPITDERIRAVMPLAAEGHWLFGEKGLSYVNRPVLMITAGSDELYPENVMIFNDLGITEKTFITYLNRGHMMIYEQTPVEHMAHFAVAFFGYHLQGCQDYAAYLSQDHVAQFKTLSWGVKE